MPPSTGGRPVIVPHTVALDSSFLKIVFCITLPTQSIALSPCPLPDALPYQTICMKSSPPAKPMLYSAGISMGGGAAADLMLHVAILPFLSRSHRRESSSCVINISVQMLFSSEARMKPMVNTLGSTRCSRHLQAPGNR